ncbi:MAG: transposase [Egibacteraceae bacterium]
MARGGIDAEALRQVLVDHRPKGWAAVFAVDTSTWERCDAETSPERGFSYHPSRHSAGQPIVAGWSYQWVVQLGWAADSPTAPVDAVRVPPDADTVTATVDQIRDLVGRLGCSGPVPLFVFDAGYDPIAPRAQLAADRAAILVRIRCDRVFSTDPDPTPSGRVGRPRRHGDRLSCADPDSWPAP